MGIFGRGQTVENQTMEELRRAYEEQWKEKFSKRLKTLAETRGIPLALLAETMECSEERVKILLAGGDFPTVPELLRLCFLCYDADEVLLGARDSGLMFLVRGKWLR